MENSCAECGDHGDRKAHHSQKLKKDLVLRLNRIEGQVRGITRMIEENVYCDDVLNQINSAHSALNGVQKLLIEAHLKSCVLDRLRSGEMEVVGEFLKTIEKMM